MLRFSFLPSPAALPKSLLASLPTLLLASSSNLILTSAPALRRRSHSPQPVRRSHQISPADRRRRPLRRLSRIALGAGEGFTGVAPMASPEEARHPVSEFSAEASGDASMGEAGVPLKLEELNWDHSFVRELPGDPRTDAIPREVLHACYTKVSPSAEVEKPELVVWSESVAKLLDVDPREFERPDFPLFFSGALSLVGGLPYAQCYGGHQFGVWAGQLGDGRAITLGELLNSRVLRSSIREFLCSEAMNGLGIPTTRALCLVTTGKNVIRDMFYDGNPKEEPGAIVCRVAQSFLRFGSYQIHALRGKEDLDIVRILADYTIRHHFPHLENMSKSEGLSFETGQGDLSHIDLTSNKYAAWSVEVAERTASLIASWQGVGFTHGVLNTDNMSILGLTIDYGPFGFLDTFDPSYTPNTTDLPGRRYCFANQPDIGLWNIAQFTTTLSTANLISKEEANYAMERYGTRFMDEYQSIMTRKLGLVKYNRQLISKLLSNMATDKVDYTNFFRFVVLMHTISYQACGYHSNKLVSSGVPDEQRKVAMNSVNPKYILRNYLCQGAIDAAEQGDYEEVRRLLKVVEHPFDEQQEMEKYARLPPAWAYRPVLL
ncbi:UPF0061 protein [Cocos nucifera]|uniref:Selenoprotein O n=1 Tax=Cocos nucifera TaxID=13894 RepID=A0A8K0HVC3_COCNU|nr:UPF0061 protein [Cocos nucifera]